MFLHGGCYVCLLPQSDSCSVGQISCFMCEAWVIATRKSRNFVLLTDNIWTSGPSESYQLIIMRPCILYIVHHWRPPVVLKETDSFLQMVFKHRFLIVYSIKIYSVATQPFPQVPVFQRWYPRQISLYWPTLSSSKHRRWG